MATFKQSASWWCYVRDDMTPERFVRAVAEIGYAAVELAPQEHWPLIHAHGLAIASANGHASIELGLNRRDQHDRIEREILASLRLAETWRIPNLICFSGSRDGCTDAEGIEATVEGLRRVARAAEDAGVYLALELLNSKVDHPGYQFDHTSWGVEVVRQVDSPRVRLLYDIYHAQIMEGDLIRTIESQHRWFCHYHTAGNPGRHEIDETQEINYVAVMRAIASTGYDGYVGQEFVPRGDTVAALRQAFELCC
ncbi:MAG: TIM barrel protein [Chloroflexi bacterium]|nr:TIM barrel protein [Chloroflexota bacterium]